MTTWPKGDRPRERLFDKGSAGLSDSELVALLMGTGSNGENAVEAARRILVEVGGLESLPEQDLRSLAAIKGVGQAKAARVVAAIELGLRIVEQRARHRVRARFVCSRDIFEAYRGRFGWLRQEVFIAVGLNNRNEIIREHTVAKGSLTECHVEPREVYRPLIADAAARVVLVHNHPSGDPSPSPSDIALTRRLAEVGTLVGIPVLDHVIIGPFSHSSLQDLGLLEAK